MNADKLIFDKMEVDIKLAREYILQQNAVVNGILHYKTLSVNKRVSKKEELSELYEKLFTLSELIKENQQLFCQLEYYTRDIPLKEVEEVDLKLLVNHLLCSADCDIDFEVKGPFLLIDENTPLTNLGRITQIYRSYSPIIVSSLKTIHMCHLFQQLCIQAGLVDVSLAIFTDESEIDGDSVLMKFSNIREIQNGCLGIITNRSDIDSAVEVFLETPSRKPWAVCNILVEECAVEKFKQAMSWKTRNQGSVDAAIAKQCTASYSYEGKLFLFEYVGEKPTERHVITINAYRTVKDLLSVAEKCVSVSLWANDVAESNELAHNLNANIIWINGFCNFNGPIETSRAYFSILEEQDSFTTQSTEEIKRVLKVQSEWLKIDVCKRVRLLRKCFNVKINLSNFVHVDKDFLCMGVTLPIGLLYLDKDTTRVFEMIALGNGLLVDINVAENNNIYNKLKEIGAPVEIVKEVSREGDMKIYKNLIYKTKVIWTSYGTIFAN
ncbi:uncharacterized protein LOC119831993 [Zerene cesonia]|uniref:uncharacterized protein LOC119831993 n=1 Tax=Zerene cesonia TaxID=33412 RepID=UPI0018E4F3E0|nr:uncharacterized protein LOC119831993 [Zerene cesonia]